MIASLKRAYEYIRWVYMQYLLNTALYMLEPPEVKLFNILLLFLLGLAVYSTYTFAPPMIYAAIAWLLTGLQITSGADGSSNGVEL